MCLTSEKNRYALYLPKQGDLSSALKLGIHGDVITPYKYRFDDNQGDVLSKGLLVACRKVSQFEVGCDSGEVTSETVYHSWIWGITLEDSSDAANFISIFPQEHLASFLDKTNKSLHILSTRDGSYGQNVILDAGPLQISGFWFNPANSLVTFFDPNLNLVVARIKGLQLSSIPNCVNFVPFDEICNRCGEGFYTSPNKTTCYPQVPEDFYMVQWGAGSPKYIIVSWFLSKDFSKFSSRLDRKQQLFLRFAGERR